MSGMPSVTKRWGLRALLACAFAGSLIATYGAPPARAGDQAAQNGDQSAQNGDQNDDDSADDWIDTKIFRGILNGLGLKNTVEPGINYHERSPLVVPPTRDLPPPQAAALPPDPAWPKDRDMTPRKVVVAKKKNAKQGSDAEEEDMRQLRPDELTGPKPARKRTADAGPAEDTTGQQLTPNQLGFKGFNLNPTKWFDRGPDVVEFKEEPARDTLTDPPAGLRTPSPKYTYGTKNTLEPTKNGPADVAVGQDVEK